MKFLGGVRQRLGVFITSRLPFSSQYWICQIRISFLFSHYFWVQVLPSKNARPDSWNAGEQCTPLKGGEGLFNKITFVHFLVTTPCFHHSSCQILVTEFVPAFPTGHIALPQESARAIDPYRGTRLWRGGRSAVRHPIHSLLRDQIFLSVKIEGLRNKGEE